jgi:hypothetical protein
MTRSELTITALIYVIALIIGQRLIAMALPEAQEAAFLIAPALASAAAAFMFYRRSETRARRERFVVGAMLAVLAIAVGLFSHVLWQTMAWPLVTLPVAAAIAFAMPFLIFPLIVSMVAPHADASPIGAKHLAIGYVALIIALAAALIMPAGVRFQFPIRTQNLPGVTISLPDWAVEEKVELFEAGGIKLKDPRRDGRYIAVYWTDSDRVQPDDYVKAVTDLPPVHRDPTFVDGHEGVTYTLRGSDEIQAVVTIWNCPAEHRVLRVFSFLDDTPRAQRGIHDRVVASVKCHTGEKGSPPPLIYPNFAPPSDFVREPHPNILRYTGPDAQTIVFAPAAATRSPLLNEDLSHDQLASLLRNADLLMTLDEPPQVRFVNDMVGHERRVWSAIGAGRGGGNVQVDLMVWYCDVRNMTFLGAYASRGRHDVQKGIDILLPAICHSTE